MRALFLNVMQHLLSLGLHLINCRVAACLFKKYPTFFSEEAYVFLKKQIVLRYYKMLLDI